VPSGNTATLSVRPASARLTSHGDVAVDGVPLAEAAERFGTPLYLLDEAEVRERCRTYLRSFPDTDVVHAAKAFLCRAPLHWVREEGLGLDVCSAGELEFAVTACFPPERIVLHGNAKSPEGLEAALRRIVGLLARIRRQYGIALPELDRGGGHAVACRPGEATLDIPSLGARIHHELAVNCAAAGIPVPRLTVEPGRALVGPAGVALHRVLAVKQTGDRTFVAVDGGMSDNPRPALYGVRYAPGLIGRRSTAEPRAATIVGRHCEAGDVLAADVPMPGDNRPGDLVAVPVAGAHHLSTASSYNAVGRPPVVAVTDGHARLLVRRENLADINGRDIGL
jgi:diaminopimelate decarboxylase